MILLERRVRGFRLVDLIGVGLLVLLILGVYLAKTMAGRERIEIAGIDREIDEEQARIRLLKAEVAHLEEPARIERLSESYLHMAPVQIRHEVEPDALSDFARAAMSGAKPAQPATRTPPPEPVDPSFDPTRTLTHDQPPQAGGAAR